MAPDEEPLRVEEEQARIIEARNGSLHQARIRIEMLPDGNLAGLAKSLRLHSPAVLHVTGHGRQDGSLVLRDEQGQAYPMSPQGLAGLIAVHKETLQLVVLNACYSRALAQMVARDIACVVGMTSEIDDDAAILFSDLFYDALFDGASVAQSFKTAVAGLSARHTAEAEHPRLETQAGIDPEGIRIV